MSLAIGETINERYQVLRQIASGGFGTTYHAFDRTEQCDVVIKESNTLNDTEQNMLLQETRILSRLVHPYLPKIVDTFFLAGQLLVVMDYIPGKDLSYYTGKQNDVQQVIPWICQVLDTLAYLHSQQPYPIVHRDIKPANIRIHDQTHHAYVLDHGISKVGNTTRMLGFGTPPYSPPEQYGGRGRTTPATDVYAAGVVLYELLTGKEPPESLDLERGTSSLVLPRTYAAAIPLALEQIILKAMALNPAQRYPDAQAMLDALNTFWKELFPSLPLDDRGQIMMLTTRLTQLEQEKVLLCKQIDELQGALQKQANGFLSEPRTLWFLHFSLTVFLVIPVILAFIPLWPPHVLQSLAAITQMLTLVWGIFAMFYLVTFSFRRAVNTILSTIVCGLATNFIALSFAHTISVQYDPLPVFRVYVLVLIFFFVVAVVKRIRQFSFS